MAQGCFNPGTQEAEAGVQTGLVYTESSRTTRTAQRNPGSQCAFSSSFLLGLPGLNLGCQLCTAFLSSATRLPSPALRRKTMKEERRPLRWQLIVDSEFVSHPLQALILKQCCSLQKQQFRFNVVDYSVRCLSMLDEKFLSQFG